MSVPPGVGGAPAGGALAVAERVSYRYPGLPAEAAPALVDLDFAVAPGEFVAVVGGNGSGKSTLVRLLAGLQPPTSGRVSVGGLDLASAEGRAAVRRRVAVVFQNPDNQIVASVVEDDIAFGPENLGLPPEAITQRVRRALEAVGMGGHARSNPHRLSGGQKQRVAIAGALAMGADLLCLDEPTSLLDPAGRREVLRVLRSLHDAGQALVLITHHMAEAAQADRVVILAAGRGVAQGRPEQTLLDGASLRGWGLEAPPAVTLWEELRARGRAGLGSVPPLLLEDLAARLRPRLAGRGDGAGHARSAAQPLPPDPGAAGEGIRLTQIAFTFPDPAQPRQGRAPAVEGVDLHVAPGECVCLLGATGSGKTTVALHCPALLRPDRGGVSVDGVSPWEASRRRRGGLLRAVRRRVGYVFQHPEDEFFEERVIDEVAFAPRNHGAGPAEALAAAAAALRAAGLPAEVAGRSPFQLSGGQMRRVAIAATLAAGPRYLVLDEPTAGLDAAGRADVLALVRALRAQGAGVLLVTHQMEEAAALADRIVIMRGGRVAAAGCTRAIFAMGEGLGALDLEPPAASRLMAELAARGAAVPTDVLTLEEAAEVLAALLPPAGPGGGSRVP